MAKRKRSQRGGGKSGPKGNAPAPELFPARLMLATPPRFDPKALAGSLEAAMGEADVACLVVDLDAEAAVEDWEAALVALLPVAQRRECAVLTSGRFELIASYGTDGVHSAGGIPTLEADLERFKPQLIVGAGELRSRHDAMEAGESGADYVLFGRWQVGASDPDWVQSRVSWWAELFEVPCVGIATSAEAVKPLAEAGADFIMPDLAVWDGDVAAKAASAQRDIDAAFALRKARLDDAA
ncbi:MAG: thiamine phosphate synthase [Pseudomonadota bacterium]